MSCSACPNQLGDEFANAGVADTLEEVLANGNITGPHDIQVSAGRSINASASGATVLTRTLYTESIAPLTFPIGTEIGILGELATPGDLVLRNNANAGGTAVKIDSIPVAPSAQANVVSYDPATKNLYYQSAGGGGVASVSAGTNISVTGTATNPIVNLRAPLTSQLDMGTQDITTSIINSDIEILPTTVDGTSATNTKAVKINCIGVGGQANPALVLNNTNATGSVAMEVYKEKPTAGAPGDVLFNQSVYGKDIGNTKQEYTRISHTIRDATVGGEDGSIEFACFVNNAVQTFIQINGNENQVNCLAVLDMNDKDITTTLGTLDLTTTGTATDIRLQPRADQDVLLTTTGANGNMVFSASNGANSTTQNITPIQYAVQTNGGINLRTTGTSAFTLEAQGTGGISINSRYAGGTGNITTQGDILVSNYSITGVGKVGLINPGASTGLAGQALCSGGGANAFWNYKMIGTNFGSLGSIPIDNTTQTDILGNIGITLTQGSFCLSPINKYKITVCGCFTGVNDVVFLALACANGASIIAGDTFATTLDPYVVENITYSGNYATSYTITDTVSMASAPFSYGQTASIYCYALANSGAHTIGNNRYNVSIEPVYA